MFKKVQDCFASWGVGYLPFTQGNRKRCVCDPTAIQQKIANGCRFCSLTVLYILFKIAKVLEYLTEAFYIGLVIFFEEIKQHEEGLLYVILATVYLHFLILHLRVSALQQPDRKMCYKIVLFFLETFTSILLVIIGITLWGCQAMVSLVAPISIVLAIAKFTIVILEVFHEYSEVLRKRQEERENEEEEINIQIGDIGSIGSFEESRIEFREGLPEICDDGITISGSLRTSLLSESQIV